MTISLNGTNGLIQAYDYQVLTTGFSYTFAAGTQVLVINPAGTLATGTITMPAAPSDGMTITVESTQQVTALTMSGNGGTVVGAAVQLIPNQPLSWVYRSTGTTWYPFFGGAGRATALVSGTSVASTSGTSIDFTSIPAWVKRITVMFSGVSTSGTSFVRFQLGVSGTPETTGYSCALTNLSTAGGVNTNSSTSGFDIYINTASYISSGAIRFTNITSNTWVAEGTFGNLTTTATIFSTAGSKSLAGILNMVRITTVNGTDTFDAGSINILYE